MSIWLVGKVSFLGVLAALAWQDVRSMRLSVLGLGAAFGLTCWLRWPLGYEAFLSAGLLLALAASTRAIVTYRLKKPALGSGDLALFFIAGLWLLPAQVPFFLMITGVVGTLFGWFYMRWTGQGRFPFGAVLAIVLSGWTLLTAA